jgi:hypothetical protein
MNAKIRALAPVPVVVLMFGLAACSGGSDTAGTAPAGSQKTPAAGAEDDADETPETPLTGDIKTKAEAAALAAYPGTVVKSEEDREKPGMYAVEVKKSDGSTVEVYLTKSYKVSGTKKEGTEEAEENNG